MSVNFYKDGELQILAGASEIPRWSGTQAEWNSLDKSTLAEGTIIEITDDLSNIFSTWTGTSAEFEALDKSTLEDGCYINITDDESVCNNNYSTSEIDTGKKWVNGKPIYRKVVEIPSSSGESNITHNLGIDFCISVSGFGYYAGNVDYLPIPYVGSEGGRIVIANITGNNFTLVSTYALSNIRIILEYTKTVDL